MRSIVLLTRLQLLQTIGGVRAAVVKRTGANGAMAGTLLVGLIILGGLGWLGYAAYGVVGRLGLATTIYDTVFIACGMLTFVFSLPTILSSFFGSSDINDLLPLPVTPFSVVFSKALGSLTTGYLWTLVFIVGPLAGWGIAAGVSFRFWVVYLLAIIFTPLMPTAYAGTLSILIAAVFKRVRRKDTITTITTVLALVLSMGAYFISSAVTSSEGGVATVISGMSQTMGGVVMAFPAYGFAVYALVHPDPLGVWMFVLLSLASFTVFVLVARVLYMRIVTSLSSSGGRAEAYSGDQAQQQTPVFKALVQTEFRKVVRNSSVLLNYVVYPTVLAPGMFVVMLSTNSMKGIGDFIQKLEDPSSVAGFVLTGIIFFVTLCASGNKIATTAVSREGSNWVHMKFVPVPMATQVYAKVLPAFAVNAVIALLFSVATGYLFVSMLRISPLMAVYGLVLMLAAGWLMVCVGAWNESRSPRVDWGDDGDVNVKELKGGGGELRAILVGLVYAALPLLATPLTKLDANVFMPVIAVVGAVASVVLGHLLLTRTVANLEAFE